MRQPSDVMAFLSWHESDMRACMPLGLSVVMRTTMPESGLVAKYSVEY